MQGGFGTALHNESGAMLGAKEGANLSFPIREPSDPLLNFNALFSREYGFVTSALARVARNSAAHSEE